MAEMRQSVSLITSSAVALNAWQLHGTEVFPAESGAKRGIWEEVMGGCWEPMYSGKVVALGSHRRDCEARGESTENINTPQYIPMPVSGVSWTASQNVFMVVLVSAEEGVPPAANMVISTSS